MKIEVKETPVANQYELEAVREQREGALFAADRYRRTVAECERTAASLNAKLARLSVPVKEYVLTLSEREAYLIGCLLGAVDSYRVTDGSPAGTANRLRAALIESRAYHGDNGGIIINNLVVLKLRAHWPEDLR